MLWKLNKVPYQKHVFQLFMMGRDEIQENNDTDLTERGEELHIKNLKRG